MGCDVPFNYSKLAEESLESSMSVVDENGDGNLTWVEYLHGQFGYTEEELEKEREKNEKNSDNHDSDYEASILLRPLTWFYTHRWTQIELRNLIHITFIVYHSLLAFRFHYRKQVDNRLHDTPPFLRVINV